MDRVDVLGLDNEYRLPREENHENHEDHPLNPEL